MKNRIRALRISLRMLFERYPLLIAAAYFCFYFPIFTLLEHYRRPQFYIHCWIDDVLPFCEYFVIPYVLWFLFVPGMLLFFLKHSRRDYLKCCKIIFGGMTICLFLYWIMPNGLMLRGKVEADNIFARAVMFLRSMDTSTNVCPSIHVSSTVGICLVLFRSDVLKSYRALRVFCFVLGTLICLSTMFLDQHSVIDVLCGMVLSTVLCGLLEQREEGLVPAFAVRKSYER